MDEGASSTGSEVHGANTAIGVDGGASFTGSVVHGESGEMEINIESMKPVYGTEDSEPPRASGV